MKYLLVLLILSSCAKDNGNTSLSVSDSSCEVIDQCTGGDGLGQYYCQAIRYNSGDISVSSKLFQGRSCLITKQDYETKQLNQSCDPKSPTETCYGWGGTYACCVMVGTQGPGAPVNLGL